MTQKYTGGIVTETVAQDTLVYNIYIYIYIYNIYIYIYIYIYDIYIYIYTL